MKNGVLTPDEYQAFRTFLEDACGIVLGDNKHYLVVSRLNRLLAEEAIETLGELVQRLKGARRDGLRERIIEAMTTNETYWFRDGYPFEVLKTRILPELAEARAPVRIWSAACSSGQEPYSISIAIQEFLGSRPGGLGSVEVVATDISPGILKTARDARYDAMAVGRGLSEERKRRFFIDRGEQWEVRPEIRGRVRVTTANLLQSYSLLGRFDVIFCRNVLIYFSSDSKRDIIGRMARALNPGGYLFLGSSESITQYSDQFELVRCNPGVVYRLKSR
ncbi:MAG TPA: protein-glutamate O-methyltransferase CheR [Gammaproteobacteria bacterium]|nr:protein-glutamate O-methyltransferase CheR [Gammaproteobacteria bacterium]